MMRGRLILLLCVMLAWASSASAQSAFRPLVFVGVQHVAPYRALFRSPGLAVTGLALWPLPRRMSAQTQVIVPTHRHTGGILLRVAVDWRVW